MNLARRAAPILAVCLLAAAPTVLAENPSGAADRVLRFRFQPAARAQIALWIERADGTFVDTVRLTQSTAYRGIGNRPGATLMNSGFRWPYGRREGVLPVWAHRRASAPGAEVFPRVIFQDRSSEGFASRTSADFSRDDYFCLSFNASTTRREALDAVSCASVFNSDKGRFMTEEDVDEGYAEPWEEPSGDAYMRPMPLTSLYPPRRDVDRCSSTGCNDHPDVALFSERAREVMPNIDAVTMATPPGDTLQTVQYVVPDAWPAGDYVAFIEVNVEGDYNDVFNDSTHPTPTDPSGTWDTWAINYGYPYRGQPSVVYRLPFSLAGSGTYATDEPVGFGDLEGQDGDMGAMSSGVITDAPRSDPGSGADRLQHMPDGDRFEVQVVATNVCSAPDPPPECGQECSETRPCSEGFACGDDGTCIGECELMATPGPVGELTAEIHEDVKMAHRVVRLSFRVPGGRHSAGHRRLEGYEIRVGKQPIDESNFYEGGQPAMGPSIDSVAVEVPTDRVPGELVEVEIGGLVPETHYWIGVRAEDSCGQKGTLRVAEVTTSEIHFTTVSPCFVATAAWGSPLADDVGTLRRFRDRHLLTHAPGRLAVNAYYAVGPHAADLIRDSEALRFAARVSLTPWVWLAELIP